MEELKELTAPEPLHAQHIIEGFNCGRSSLNEWLLRRARRNETSGDSRTYVVCNAEKLVIAYYSLAAGQVLRVEAPKALTRNAPDPIPIIILGRLAITLGYQGKGLGAALLRDAAYRAKAASAIIGARALLVHALDKGAQSFYEAHGFSPSPVAPLTLMLAFKHLEE